MKIGVNSRLVNYARSGIPVVISNLYTRLPKIDLKNSYLLFQPERALSPLESAWFDNFSILDLAQKNRVDVLHGPAHTLPWTKPRGMKYLLTVHDLSFLLVPQMSDFAFKVLYGLWMKRSVQLADHIVTDSESTKMDLIRLFSVDPNRITTIYLGVDIAFVPGKNRTNGKYLMTVATHPKRKNLQLLLQTYKLLVSEYDLDLKVVGQLLPEHQQMLKEAGLMQRVQHFEYMPQEELIELYQNAEALVYPSLYEGFGLPVLEAMACGVPALCSDNSSLPEIQVDSSQRFDPSDKSDLESKLKTILDYSETERSRLAKSNVQNAKRFSWDKTALEYMRVIHTM